MNNCLCKLEDVKKMIKEGEFLMLAGDERMLEGLPSGNWIAGTIPYFMSQNGGEFNQQEIFVTKLSEVASDCKIRTYSKSSIENVYSDMGDNSAGIVIIPATSETHLSFATNAPNYKEFAFKPLVGWISGVNLDDLGKSAPKVYASFDGRVEVIEDGAVAVELILPQGKVASINMVNIFEMGEGDTIEFKETSFSARTAIVNGEEQNFAEYVNSKGIDIKVPLMANYGGAKVNISFQNVEEDNVAFYAPVFKGVQYKQAKPVTNYVEEFEKSMPSSGTSIAFSCNCILNYLYSELEGKKTGSITGPITFGEVAYQLLNQTLAYLVIEDA